ncbi:MAG: sigma-70 family RNA polymerase sigma factor [Chloroflexi bacterium]|nr:MAG: sigma-70 family RNA polymerase sigma factor [Chloroflexota bacterium]
MSTDERPRLGEEQRRWLADLHARHYEPLLRMAGRALPPPSRANAEDVVQTVFLEAAAEAARRPSRRVGKGWLITRLRSRIVDHRRRSGRQQRLLAAAAAADVTAPQAAPSAEEVVVARSRVDDLLATIPDRDDQLTLVFKLYGYSEAEIARRMSLGAAGRPVRDRLQRARKQMRATRAAPKPEPALPAARTLAAVSAAAPLPRARAPTGST